MAANKPKTYQAALDQGRALLAQARLNDPAEHFPYKHAEVTALLDAGGPMGPGVPDRVDGESDTSRTVDDYMSQAIADATRDYVEAQEAYLRSLSDDDAAEYAAARDRLQAARLDHRENRDNGFTIGAAARRGR